MARNIAQVVHDLKPPLEVTHELAKSLHETLEKLSPSSLLAEAQEAMGHLVRMTETVNQYMVELKTEAEREGIRK